MEASLNGPLGRTVLGQGTLKIGRAPDNTIVINDPQSSAHHMEITPGFDGNSYQVTDLNSTNGTFVNEQRLTSNLPRPLATGDVIRIGLLNFTYEASSGYAPTVFANSFNNDQTVPSQAPIAQPPAFGNYNVPSQPSNIPPPAFTPSPASQQPTLPRMEYPQVGGQPGYAQPGSFNQQGYPQPQPGGPGQPGYPQPQPGGPGQPGYPQPQPEGFGQPSYPQQKKSRAGLWIGLIVLLLLIVGGSIGTYVYVNRSTPEKTLQAFCTSLQNNNAQGYYDTLSSKSKASTDLNKISTELGALKLLFGGFTGCTYSNVQQNGSTATATLTLTPARGKAFGGPVRLVDENGQWKMDDSTASPATTP